MAIDWTLYLVTDPDLPGTGRDHLRRTLRVRAQQ